jgi:hypothetical protein
VLATIHICVVNARPAWSAKDAEFRHRANIFLAFAWALLVYAFLRTSGVSGFPMFVAMFFVARRFGRKDADAQTGRVN